MNMEWLNQSAGFSGLGMSSTGSSHCRQYIVSFNKALWQRVSVGLLQFNPGLLEVLKEKDVAESGWGKTDLSRWKDVGESSYSTGLGWWSNRSQKPDV